MTALFSAKKNMGAIEQKVDALNWAEAVESLCARGYGVTDVILTPEECAELIAIYGEEKLFRSHIVMERYRFGIGDYKYFENPLPELVAELRTAAYPHLANIANRWTETLGAKALGLGGAQKQYPLEHGEFLKLCHKAGQKKPTPLMLHYEAGGYNCLHQDLYGEVSFPLQMVIMLGQAGRDWEGRRVYFGGAAAARAIESGGGEREAGAGDYFHHAIPSGERGARLLSSEFAPRCQPRASRNALHAGDHFSRREIAFLYLHQKRPRDYLETFKTLRGWTHPPATI